jgi:hypothetical protein
MKEIGDFEMERIFFRRKGFKEKGGDRIPKKKKKKKQY